MKDGSTDSNLRFTPMRSIALVFALLAMTGAIAAPFRVERDDVAGELRIFDGEQAVLTYAYRDGRVRRPYFANVAAPNGARVTRNWPPRAGIDPVDHDTMHPGIWLAFGDINGADFWRGKASVRHDGFIEAPTAGDDGVRFVVENAYVHEDAVLCTERAAHAVLRRRDGYLLLFDSTFFAAERLDFGDQQEMGLGVRLATPLRVRDGTGRIVNSEGQVNEAQVWGKRATWCDYSGTIDGVRAGALLMPDPRNVRPSRFHSRDYGFIAANPFSDKDFIGGREHHAVVEMGERLRLRFGVLVYGRSDAKPIDLDAAYADYLRATDMPGKPSGRPWTRHTIDAGSRGADGVRVADLDGDGLPDVTTGWEEGGEVRVYLNPGAERSTALWPKVIVGRVAAPEDAVFVDLDSDGRLDVVSSCEGRERTVHAHFAPRRADELLDGGRWTTAAFPATRDAARWMFCLPLQIDGERGVDLVIGAKGTGAQVGWLRSPADPRKLEDWSWHGIMDARWIMSLRDRDVDGDGDPDLIVSDRREAASGVWWLENPGPALAAGGPWRKHPIAGLGREVMFLDIGDLDGDGREDIVCAVRQGDLVVARRLATAPPMWEETTIPMPTGTGTGKGIAIGDVDGDRTPDVVVTCERAKDVSGAFWLRRSSDGSWAARDISGVEEGVKFDRIELLDLDDDGDLDVLTCEETANLGVIWYENPG